MATIREIKRRIIAVKSTQKITRAMQMVAAAKLRRVQGLVVQSTLFYGTLDLREAAQRIFPLLLDGFRGANNS